MFYQLRAIAKHHFTYQCKPQFTKATDESRMLSELCKNHGLLVKSKDSQGHVIVADINGKLFSLTFIRIKEQCHIEANCINHNQH